MTVSDAFTYFDRLSERSIPDLEACREAGVPVAGIYCIYAPTELIRAAGIVPVGLCGKKEAPIQYAETVLPSNLCPLIKSSYGYAASDTCPYFSLTDFVVGETTCDGKKKMYEFLGRLKPLYLMHLPYDQKGHGAGAFWRSELERFCGFLYERSGVAATDERLAHQIRLHNRMRRELRRVVTLAADRRSPLGSLQIMTILESKSFVVDLETYVGNLTSLRLALEKALGRSPKSDGPAPGRILLTGCPVGKGCEKVLRLVEAAGASVVCMENCTGMKSILTLVEERAAPRRAIAERYLDIPCSCMTPNDKRMASIRSLVHEFDIQGIVDMTWQFCHTYNIESQRMAQEVQASLNIPFLNIETDYSPSDTEQLRTRIEAFLEIVSKDHFN